MKKLLALITATTMLAGVAQAEDVKIGILLGFTGPLESIAPSMEASAQMAIKEANASGMFLGGSKITTAKADSTCIDASAATASAERLISSEKVHAIMGAMCSGATTAALQNVALPKGVVMISPSATSPALSTLEDNGLFFRTSPSDARQGQVIAGLLKDKGVKTIALTYTNNDYGKGLADSIINNFKKVGGKVSINAPHDDGKGDYSAEVGALAAAGGDVLVVAGYADQGGKGIIQTAIDLDAFETFVLPDGMVGESILKNGFDLDGSYGVVPGSDSDSANKFEALTKEAGFVKDAFSSESYDATALILLSMQAAKSTKSEDFKGKVMDVANAPGTKIHPGEIAKGLKILAEGGEVDYVGASDVELVGAGESAGNYKEVLIKDNKNTTVGFR